MFFAARRSRFQLLRGRNIVTPSKVKQVLSENSTEIVMKRQIVWLCCVKIRVDDFRALLFRHKTYVCLDNPAN